MIIIYLFFALFVLIVPILFTYSVYLALKNIKSNFNKSAQNTYNKYVKILLMFTVAIDFTNIIVWILCASKAIQPHHDPAIINFIEYYIFAFASVILRAISFRFFTSKSLKVRYSVDLIISFIAILKLSHYGYNALVNL